MRNRLPLFAASLLLLLLLSCNNPAPEEWTDLVPDKTPFVILPERDATLREMLQAPYIPLFEEMSPATIQLAGEMFEEVGVDLDLLALLLYPDTSSDWQPVWLLQSREGVVRRLAQRYQRRFVQNRYRFKGELIEIVTLSNRSFYLLELGPFTLLSQSSLAIEDMLRTLYGELPKMTLGPQHLQPGSFIINTPNLERWLEQIADISYRPMLQNAFEGTLPVATRLATTSGEQLVWRLRGEIPVERERSPLIHAVSAPGAEFLLDRYISVSASAFSLMRLEPRSVPPADTEPAGTLDEHLVANSELYSTIASALDPELAFVAFAETGFMSSSEFIFLRRLQNPSRLNQELAGLADQGLIERLDGGIYYLNSPMMGRLLGGDLSPLGGFYLAIHDQAAALSRSNSLVISIGNDYSRRRVVFYEENYTSIRENMDPLLSSFTYVDAPAFNSYMQPWLYPQNYFSELSSGLDILTIATARADENAPLTLEISSHSRETTRPPFAEQWSFPLQSEITGAPVLTNITGSSRDEIIFSTREGSVYVLAVDGSPVTQVSTSPDRPVGPPLVYDWYGNNQNVIMQAAGRRIYAWDEAGSLLPNFPVTLDEPITTPLQVMDVTRNGVAEMIVTTADRYVHILNARGNPVSGWPQITNSVVLSRPVLSPMGEQRSVFAFAENGLHAWNINGIRRSGFPIFIESRFNGSPFIFGNHVLGAGANGHLYATGPSPLFDPSLSAATSGDSLYTSSINVSNNSLNSTPRVYNNEMLRAGDELIREDLILTQSSNGSVQLYNSAGVLRFTESMGQPASDEFEPQLLDLNRNNRTNVVALASSGRLYAWDLISGNRLQSLPTSAMSFPVFKDLNNDGNLEIVAQTREGIRVWTIYR